MRGIRGILNEIRAIHKKPGMLLLIFFILIGFGLRFYLTDSFVLSWDDARCALEGLNVIAVTMPSVYQITPPGGILELLRTYHHPPIRFIIIALSFYLLGVTFLSLHLPFVIFGTLSIYVIFLVGKEMYSEKEGLIAAGLLSVAFYHVSLSRISEQPAPFIFFVLISLLYLNRFLKLHSQRDFQRMEIFLALAVMTVQYGLFFMFLFNYFVYRDVKLRPFLDRRNRKWLLLSLIIWVPFYVFYFIFPAPDYGYYSRLKQGSASAKPGLYFNLPWIIEHLFWWTGPLFISLVILFEWRLKSEKSLDWFKKEPKNRFLAAWIGLWLIPWTFFMLKNNWYHLSLVVALILLLSRLLAESKKCRQYFAIVFSLMLIHTCTMLFTQTFFFRPFTTSEFWSQNLVTVTITNATFDMPSAVAEIREMDKVAFISSGGIPVYITGHLASSHVLVWYRFNLTEKMTTANGYTFDFNNRHVWAEEPQQALVAIVLANLTEDFPDYLETIANDFCLHSNHNSLDLYVRCDWAAQYGFISYADAYSQSREDMIGIYPKRIASGQEAVIVNRVESDYGLDTVIEEIRYPNQTVIYYIPGIVPEETVFHNGRIINGLFIIRFNDTLTPGTYSVRIFANDSFGAYLYTGFYNFTVYP